MTRSLDATLDAPAAVPDELRTLRERIEELARKLDARLCVDCHVAEAADGIDTCQRCQDLADELEAELEDCRDAHGGPQYCNCTQLSNAARVLRAIEIGAQMIEVLPIEAAIAEACEQRAG